MHLLQVIWRQLSMATSHLGRALRAGAATAVVMAGLTFSPGAASGANGITLEVNGLNGPRGVAVGPAGRIVYSESDGTVSRVTGAGNKQKIDVLANVTPGFAPAVSTVRGTTWILTTGGAPGTGAGTLYRWTAMSQEATPLADIQAYQLTDPDPEPLDGDAFDSNPFGVQGLPDGSALVADAAGNDLLRVYPDGDIVTVARIKPRTVLSPDFLPDPPPGTPIPSEGVATSVTLGSDGYYYVGELRGFPATPGTSQIWRIAPDAVGAVCDPEAPDTGDCTRYADGFTSIFDLAPGPDGSMYVLEFNKDSWLAFESGVADPFGGLFRIPAGGGAATELVPDQLILPGGMDVSPKGEIFVTEPVFGKGALVRVTTG
ncbi:MAG: ScyD/ScyE family protein [Geodermatophilaceae bacterium]|nr:ScyD/ScyE family protein [Geodermatophilaceae bacterium]